MEGAASAVDRIRREQTIGGGAEFGRGGCKFSGSVFVSHAGRRIVGANTGRERRGGGESVYCKSKFCKSDPHKSNSSYFNSGCCGRESR